MELTEQQEEQLGAKFAEILKLRKDREKSKRWEKKVWQLTTGAKTDLGLYRTIKKMVLDIEEGNLDILKEK